MRRLYLPLSLLGVAGLAALVLSERGRETARRLWDEWQDAPEPFREWNDSAQRELEKLQEALRNLHNTLAAAR